MVALPIVQHRGTPNAATAFPTLLERSIAVNLANRQLALGDTNGTPLALLAVRYFSTTSQYAVGDFVVQAGVLYRARVAISPGAFTGSQWDEIAGGPAGGVSQGYVDAQDALRVAKAGDTMGGPLFLPNADPTDVNHATRKSYVDGQVSFVATNANNRVAKIGDTMTGHLTLPTGPAAANAVRKDYVDAADATLQTNINAKAATTYVDSQDALKVAKAGDTMTGELVIQRVIPALVLDRTDTQGAQIRGRRGGVDRWWIVPGMGNAETGSNAGSDFQIARYNDAGAQIDAPLNINRSTGQIITTQPILPTTTWTVAQQDAARASIFAAPNDVMAYSGMQVNGSFEVAQEFGSTVQAVGGGNRIADIWIGVGGGAPWSMTIERKAVVFGDIPFKNCAVMSCTTTAAVAANDTNQFYLPIEGNRLARLMWGTTQARPITIAFWALAITPGTYSVAVRNSATNRCYVQNFTISGSSLWEYKTITIPGDTTGTWLNDNGVGMYLSFMFTCGTNQRTATVGAWQAGNFIASNTMGNAFAANGNYIGLANVMVLPGSYAPPADRQMYISRPLDQELPTVQRYWRYCPYNLSGFQGSSTNFDAQAYYPAMRGNPTVTMLGAPLASTLYVQGGGYLNLNGINLSGLGVTGGLLRFDTSAAGAGVGNVGFLTHGAQDKLTLNARL